MLLRYLSAAVLSTAGCAASRISFLDLETSHRDHVTRSALPDLRVLEDALEALRVMQADYFQPWLGMWPTSIDWTAAMMGSHVSGALESISQGLELIRLEQDEEDYRVKENLVTLYFSQLVGYYFGQDAFAIRNEAFDDMLWVVLGWLDTTQFIELHTALHYRSAPQGVSPGPAQELPTLLRNQTWHGNIWIPAFAHRARIFWELAARGWDAKLCGGGMTWNPRLEPYKNAITNELFISASIAMYLHFPGDANTSPYGSPSAGGVADSENITTSEWRAHDPRFLHAATRAYAWLRNSGMTNNDGLYVDGFHISGYNNQSDNNTKCDVRNEMVYTYNQGVVLSGLLGLFKVTGNASYLKDGHRLIQDVISATGYDLRHDRPIDDLPNLEPGQLPPWRGIGRAGVLEEVCDVRGDCSQNGHTFKGIYFHHLTAFCAPLEFVTAPPPPAMGEQRLVQIRKEHARACQAYLGWIKHNAVAALLTRDAYGKFGMWWTAGLLNVTLDALDLDQEGIGPTDANAADYRNYGVPDDALWTPPGTGVTPPKDVFDEEHGQRPLGGRRVRRETALDSDPNNRGRGRTVESQGGGLAVLRALWEISRQGFD
ncbi:glycoside hydrolase, family 76 [Coniochaeta ligniaria NRRL 30616]|uniref:Glycoside hydrolase, family 76 n=1 Tax=Coniochaeta ligniaria NRRL 30616 TaxID=1408157 RepID=A0A1J7J487_9PEZI|nr:glycoside hydrolase, family 76 [Coniochaeta ligniaria NRRL 30616]